MKSIYNSNILSHEIVQRHREALIELWLCYLWLFTSQTAGVYFFDVFTDVHQIEIYWFDFLNWSSDYDLVETVIKTL